MGPWTIDLESLQLPGAVSHVNTTGGLVESFSWDTTIVAILFQPNHPKMSFAQSSASWTQLRAAEEDPRRSMGVRCFLTNAVSWLSVLHFPPSLSDPTCLRREAANVRFVVLVGNEQ